jgi:hypothetical protein
VFFLGGLLGLTLDDTGALALAAVDGRGLQVDRVGMWKYPSSALHVVRRQDAKRIGCQSMGCRSRSARAAVCEHSYWNAGNTTGMSFYYLCRACALRSGLLAGKAPVRT